MVNSIQQELMNSLQSRRKDCFYGSSDFVIFKNISNNGVQAFKLKANQFLTNAISYLKQRYDFGDESIYKNISVLNLKQSVLSWNTLSK